MYKKIAIVIGHDEFKQGAYGNKDISEWIFNQYLMYDIIKNMDPEIKAYYKIFFRDPFLNGYTNKMIDLHKRIDEWGAYYSVELHFNGSNNPSVNGHEVLYLSSGGEYFANILNNNFTNSLVNNNRGIKKVSKNDRGYGFISRGKSKAIIAEPFFSLNQDLFLENGPYRKGLIKAYKNAFEYIIKN